MRRSQAYELIGIAWLALAAFDGPADWGTLFYAGMAAWSFIRAAGKPE